MKVVPWPTVDSTVTWPPAWVTMACTAARPRPVPRARPLVVKKGSKQCSTVSGSIPAPVSDTIRATTRHDTGRSAPITRVRNSSRPPLGMASRALMTMFSSGPLELGRVGQDPAPRRSGDEVELDVLSQNP